ncbi:hypothetical protein KJ656_06990 [bacterium]|nr:hypothetical protein [bacterium]
MSILKIFKRVVFGKSQPYVEKEICQEIKEIDDLNSYPKLNEFIKGKRNYLSSKDVFPELKVFEPVKTPKIPTLDQIYARLKNAEKSIPLPAGYKDTCICIRMLIKYKIKRNENYEKWLKRLYKVACEYDFFASQPYLYELREPSFNLSEVLPKKEISCLKMPYHEIGYRNSTILNKTDIKWLVSHFGEPKAHIPVNDFHKETFNKAVGLLKEERKRQKNNLWKM